ncbi:MAG: NADH-quinone oxidoreductase subunit J [Actinomyces ruminicola]|uniref:NADH-quinone oxidoreductase subunit J n=1 Tax=Actinomyces ruminicola TaxID=332524 RepID=A0A1G9SRA5_9ACTO|nr:NADH-quinone oxidoreductase subunit J [Actinomyces ruminicola]MBE6482539.1 NADH-quinone oxidoreductase subunit J [Actinomyces ruminicola]SDM37989.1 NADH-quinone oxidoreductase subunit J [Actinomyces ruminicola]
MNPLTTLPATLTADGSLSGGETVLFAVVSAIMVACGFILLTAKRAVNAAVSMILIMICLAVLYVANEAPFLGIIQVVVYTGAVMTLVLFVIMLVGVGGDEPVAAHSAATKWLLAVFGIGLIAVIAAVVWRTAFPAATGLDVGDEAIPQSLAAVLFGDHVVTMELTGILLITAAVGALTLTHRQRVRPRLSQRDRVDARMRAYAASGAHPGQKPMSGVYASTNTAAAPALSASGEALEESVSPVLRMRGQALELSDVSPEMSDAQRAGRITQREDATVGRSGMPAMPGAPAPVVTQPVAPAPAGAADASGEAAEETEEEHQ